MLLTKTLEELKSRQILMHSPQVLYILGYIIVDVLGLGYSDPQLGWMCSKKMLMLDCALNVQCTQSWEYWVTPISPLIYIV